MFAGVLDGFDGRIARLLRAQSKFGAELELAERQYRVRDCPGADRLPLVACRRRRGSAGSRLWRSRCAAPCAWRDSTRGSTSTEQPHKSAGFNTGVPAPAGAGLAFVPIYLWLITGDDLFRRWELVMAWTLFIAVLMISSLPTYSWSSIRIRSGWRLFALAGVALLGAALIRAPWLTLLAIATLYLAMLPFSIASLSRGSSGGAQLRLRPHRLAPLLPERWLTRTRIAQ